MPECGAKKRGGGTCGAPPMKGQKRCARHGGKSPQAQRAAEKQIAEQEAQETLEKAIVTLGLARTSGSNLAVRLWGTSLPWGGKAFQSP